MGSTTRTTDKKARVSLPAGFANATVIIEQLSATELRIRKAQVIAEDELPFREESAIRLSDRDRDLFLAALEAPPSPSVALRNAAGPRRRRNA